MVDLLEQPDRGEVLVGEHVLDRVVRRGRDARLPEPLEPDGGRVGGEVFGDEGVELLDVLRARVERRVAGLVGELGAADHREEARPVALRVDERGKVSVGGRERTACRRRDPRVPGFSAGRHEDAAPLMLHQTERRHELGHRHLDGRARTVELALAQRGGDRERRRHPGDLVGNRVGGVRRLAVHPRLRAGDAGHRLHGVVVGGQICVGTVGAEADDGTVHERGVDREQGVRVGAATHRGVAPHVVHHDVAGRHQLGQAGAAVGGLEVEHDAALAPVAREEDRGHPLVGPRSEVARDVTRRRLDLHHVGTEVREEQGAVGTGDHRGEVDDAHAVERKTGHRRSVRGMIPTYDEHDGRTHGADHRGQHRDRLGDRGGAGARRRATSSSPPATHRRARPRSPRSGSAAAATPST